MEEKRKENGITLIAVLAIVIVVLFVIIGVVVACSVVGSNIKKKADITEKNIEVNQEWQENIEKQNEIQNQYGNGNDNLENAVEISTLTEKVDKNTLAKDSLGNPITIPEGFKVVIDGESDVEYNYREDKKPTVQDGIVIEDEEGNQFVWVPVGNIKNKDGSSTKIELARYTFDITINPETHETSGTGKIKQTIIDGSGLIDEWSEAYGDEDEYLEEVSTSTTYGNAKAKNIEEFKTKSKANGGYYLARYEASKGEDNKVKSKSATIWDKITQLEAATKAREMYKSTNFESDLVNSYAWDTAIVFIQAYSGDSDYSKEVGTIINSNLANTGTKGDKRCNIYDMASNAIEWTTETCTLKDYPCTSRGGYDADGYYVALRTNSSTSGYGRGISFRPLIYITK